jgi:DNA segregation ATPase FtsK/SpoIIIE-like protein
MDDTPALLEMTDKLILSAMNYISSQGRAPGVHLIFGAQDWTNAGIGSGIVKANVKARMIFGAASTTKAAASAGRGKSGAHLIEGKGDALYINSNVEIPVAASMVTNRMLLELVQQKYGNPSPRPWRP